MMMRFVLRLGLAFSLMAGVAMSTRAENHVFELNAPQAKEVFLAGEMTEWATFKLHLLREADGVFRRGVELGDGQWVYKYVVDDQWIADPANPDHDSDGQGGQHSILFVGPGDWQERADVPHGQVDTAMLPSKAWHKPMKVHVYLPPGYQRGQPYPVLLLLHGMGMDADQWLRTGKINRYMDNLLARQAIQPFVIVMPSSEAVYYDQPRSETHITQELPAWLKDTYGLSFTRERAGVAGMSMGGLGAFHLPLRHPRLFGWSYALSGYYSDRYIAALPKLTKLTALPMQSILVCGSEDELVQSNRKLVRALQQRHIEPTYRESPGGHTWQYWSHLTTDVLTQANSYFSHANPGH